MMGWPRTLLLLGAIVFGLLKPAPVGQAGPLLEEILNCPRLGEHSGSRDEAQFATIEPGKPVGQTFIVGEEVEEVFRIAIWQAFWHESWQPDEVLVMTLWDGPEKRISYGRSAIPYARRMWEGAVPMFPLRAKVQPYRSYYFELTVEVEPLRPAVTPREWALSGKRPGFAGGDGVLAGIGVARDDYPRGRAFVGGQPQDFDLWFEVHVRHRCDRERLYREAFKLFNLDYPPLQPLREAVERKDWEEAIRRLVSHFEGRQDLIPLESRQPRFNPEFDTREADLACEQKVLLPDGTTVDLGPSWNHYALWPERGGVGLTRSGLRKCLAQAYANTGNEKYARAFSDMLFHLFLHSPSPLRAGVFRSDEVIPAALPPGLAGGSMWSGLSIGARMGHGLAYYGRFVPSPFFPLDLRAAFIINLGEMAEVLERMRGSGNWETQMADALFEFGLTYPEFKGAKRWVQQGIETLVRNALSTVLPDGVLQEPSINYHLLVMGRYLSVLERTRGLGIKVPEEMVRLTEKMHEYVMFSALPDGSLPLWGDANPPVTVDVLAKGAQFFQREDFRFVATGGKEGTPPRQTSMGFPHGGFYYMRSSWQPDAHYLGLHCGPHGSHGHLDALSFILSSHGRLVLIDPGVYIYGTPEAQELSSTFSHNTVTVDRCNESGGGEADLWVTSKDFDFFAGHNKGYRGLPGVRHYRRLWFLKPGEGHEGLWLLWDDVVGHGEHEAQLWFHFAPIETSHDQGRRLIWTSGDGGNLLLQEIQPEEVALDVRQSIAAVDWTRLTQVPVVCFRRKGTLPLAFTTLLLPFQGQKVPEVKANALSIVPKTPGARALWVEVETYAFLFLVNGLAALQGAPETCQVSLPDGGTLAMAGSSLVMGYQREERGWRPCFLYGVRLLHASFQGKPLFRSEVAQDKVEIAFPGQE